MDYLNLMLNNKADFILEYNEASSPEPLKKEDVDWSQSRIIFIAPEFTRYQQHAIGFKDLCMIVLVTLVTVPLASLFVI